MKNYTVKNRRYFVEPLIMVLFGFLVCFCIGSVLNILLKTTQKRDWLITFFISLGLAIIVVPILNSNWIYYFGWKLTDAY